MSKDSVLRDTTVLERREGVGGTVYRALIWIPRENTWELNSADWMGLVPQHLMLLGAELDIILMPRKQCLRKNPVEELQYHYKNTFKFCSKWTMMNYLMSTFKTDGMVPQMVALESLFCFYCSANPFCPIFWIFSKVGKSDRYVILERYD